MKLDERLTAVFDEINAYRVVDIGCDHGKLGVALLLKNKVQSVQFVDISEKSIAKAQTLVKKFGLEKSVNFIVEDGANVSWNGNDIVVVAGLGGNEIVNIIGNKNVPKGSIFVPHQDADVLREYFNVRDITVSKDFVVKSKHKFYDILVVGDGEKFDNDEIFLGKNLPNSEAYKEKVDYRLEQISKYVSQQSSEKLKKEKECLEHAKTW